MKDINKVLTAPEAAQLWGISRITVVQACSGYKGRPPRFTSDECRKSGPKTWLITIDGMKRVFGSGKSID